MIGALAGQYGVQTALSVAALLCGAGVAAGVGYLRSTAAQSESPVRVMGRAAVA